MAKMGMNLQDSFLNQVRKDNTEIMLVLLDGTRLNGFVRGFDNFTVIMSARGQQHLIYKHAIAQIISRRLTHTELEHEAAQPEEAPLAAEAEAELATQPTEGGAAPQERPPRREDSRREDSRRNRDRDESRRHRDEARRKEEADHKDKFNAIDLSRIKVDDSAKQ